MVFTQKEILHRSDRCIQQQRYFQKRLPNKYTHTINQTETFSSRFLSGHTIEPNRTKILPRILWEKEINIGIPSQDDILCYVLLTVRRLCDHENVFSSHTSQSQQMTMNFISHVYVESGLPFFLGKFILGFLGAFSLPG